MFEIAPTNMQIDFIKKLDNIKEFCKYAKIIETQRKENPKQKNIKYLCKQL